MYRICPFKRPRGRYILQKICKKTYHFILSNSAWKKIFFGPEGGGGHLLEWGR